MRASLKSPKVLMVISLGLIYASALYKYPQIETFLTLVYSVGFCAIFDLLFTFIRRRQFFVPWAAFVSGLIIALIADQNALWFQILVISALSMGTKNFLRIDGRHILNPAASGLVLGGLIFGLGISWWGVSFQSISTKFTIENFIFFLTLLSPLIVSFFKLNRFGSILTFFITYTFLTVLFFGNFSINSFFNLFLNPGTIFFALVMLPEPMTSPLNLRRQVFFGGFIALISLALTFALVNHALPGRTFVPDILATTLLLGNLIFFRQR